MEGSEASRRSVQLLERVHEGDGGSLAALLEEHQAWLWSFVRARMGTHLKELEASGDVVQDVFRKLLEAGPRFLPRDDDEFRRLVGTIVLNRLRDLHRKTQVRARTAPPSDGDSAVTQVGALARSADSPSQVAIRNEERALVGLALALCDPDDALVLRLRNWDGLSFEELGQSLGIAPDAARMRFSRALLRLGAMMRRIEEGRLDEIGGDP